MVAHLQIKRLAALVLAALAPSASAMAQGAPAAPAEEAIAAHVHRAEALAGTDLKAPLFLCRADSGVVVRDNLVQGQSQWLPATRLFDNIFYIGNRFVGVFVVKTSAGLILFDSTTSQADVEQHLVPGLAQLGLDPHDIRYVIVTHGHWDHFGGAAYLQQTYGARIGLSAADWNLIEKAPATSAETFGHPAPRRDLVVTDGQRLVLGDTAITLYLTPGHTPGTVSAIVPGHEGGRVYPLSLLGSVAFPPAIEPTERFGGLRKYQASVVRFGEISRRAGAVGLLNTHVFADGGLTRLAAAQTRTPAQPNPFVLGSDAVARYYGLLGECLQAAQLRPQPANGWASLQAAGSGAGRDAR